MNEYSFAIPYPPSVNHYWRYSGHAKVYVPRKFLLWRESVRKAVAQARFGNGESILPPVNFPFLGKLSVGIDVFPPDARKRDLDNILKGALDALTMANVWADDSQIDLLTVRRCSVDRSGGHLEVKVEEI